jgi:hypothetical protein
VPPTLEFGSQPDVDNPLGKPRPQHIAGQAEDVGIVMQSAKLGRQVVMTWSRSHTRKLVSGDCHSQTGSADENAAVYLFFRNHPRHSGCDVRIITGACGKGAHIDDLMARLADHFHDPLTQPNSPMITSDSNFHGKVFCPQIVAAGLEPVGSPAGIKVC